MTAGIIVKLVILGVVTYAIGNLNPARIIAKLYGVDITK